jgi:hypothetical protein
MPSHFIPRVHSNNAHPYPSVGENALIYDLKTEEGTGPGLAVAFLGQKFRPPTIRPPSGLWGAFGGLMIQAGAHENAVFWVGQADMTLSDRHTHNLAV